MKTIKIELSKKDKEILYKELSNPKKPNEYLKKTYEDYINKKSSNK